MQSVSPLQVYLVFKQLHRPTLDCDLFVRRLLIELHSISDTRLAALRAACRPEIVRAHDTHCAHSGSLNLTDRVRSADRPARRMRPLHAAWTAQAAT